MSKTFYQTVTYNQWVKAQLPESKTTGRPNLDSRTVFNAILFVLETGAKWRHIPEKYGNQAIGVSRGGKTTKVHALVNENFKLLKVMLTA